MKTKIIIQRFTVMFFMIITSVFSNAQNPVIMKTLNVTVYAATKYEASKQHLLALIDSCKCVMLSMSETKTDNGSQKAIIEISANDNGFKMIDKSLPSLGYVSFKNLKTEDKSAELDTIVICKEIAFYKIQKVKYEKQLSNLKPDNSSYNEIWKEEAAIETKIFEKEKLLVTAKNKLTSLHKISITLSE
jgi:hypothetical protein